MRSLGRARGGGRSGGGGWYGRQKRRREGIDLEKRRGGSTRPPPAVEADADGLRPVRVEEDDGAAAKADVGMPAPVDREEVEVDGAAPLAEENSVAAVGVGAGEAEGETKENKAAASRRR